ncbi:PDZ domain-containing protein [bacterium]|nr:PDZ domain-containing protein [bacterium]
MKKTALIAVISVLFTYISANAQEARLLRQPDICGNRVVFVYGGNLYTVPVSGGTAEKLTTSPGFEVFPKFSPDGKWIAFSGEYDGSRQIYVIPSEGGIPKRCTFYPDGGNMPPRGGWDNLAYDWTADSKKILVRSARTPFGERIGKYFLVDPFNEGLPAALQPHEGGPATLSPDGTKLAYSIKSREFRTWKRYKAGFAQDIWIYDLKNNTIDRVTDYPGTDNFPMWVGNTIYFTSDRSSVDSNDPRTLNIFAYDIASKKIRQITRFTDYDVMRPSRGTGGIVFENGGFLYILDPATEKYHKISVYIKDDLPGTRPYYKNVSKFVGSFDISPNAKRALFGARGEMFTVPAKHGQIQNISNTPEKRELSVSWSSDGKYIAYMSLANDDYYEIFIKEYDSDKKPVQLTSHSKSWITNYIWSYDNKKILLSDKKNRLRMADVQTKDITLIDRGTFSSINDFSWSPDNKWVAYSKTDKNMLSAIWIYSIEQKKNFRLTGSESDDYSPVFSFDGKTLSFISRRDYDWSSRDFKAKIYIGTLTKDQASPFAPINDDEGINNEDSDTNKKDKDKKVQVKIEPEGFASRVVAYPIEAGSYYGITPVKGGILYLYKQALYKFDMKDRKQNKILDKVRSYVVTSKGDKFLYNSGSKYGIADLKPGQKSGVGLLNLSGMTMKIDPRAEWKEIYNDAYRIMRDWFYDPHMHGVNWAKMRDKYAPLVNYAATRTDMDYIIGELISELNSGHCYVHKGDVPKVKHVPMGLIGCEFKPAGKFYKISRIFKGQNWTEKLRSPLTEPGVHVKSGEYLIAVDGKYVFTNTNPYKYFENKADKLITLLINDKPTKAGARKVVVKTIGSELALRQFNWVERNRAIVDSLSGGRIGYIYVPNTSFPGFREFYKGWYSQFTKDGLIIDDRYNGGGSIPYPMAKDLSLKVLQFWARRNMPLYSEPFPVNEGPKVMLINGRSSSGGDAFPSYFRLLKVGPLMGQKTWGGLIGYSGSPHFVDGGGLAVPAFAYVNKQGKWDVEYYGVSPDIEVFDDPSLIFKGHEPMLEHAVDYILKQLKKNPPKKIKKPKPVDRS